MIPDQVEREISIAAPVERVWAALTEAEYIGAEFGAGVAEIDLRLGGARVCRWRHDGLILTRVDRLEPRCLFSYRWVRPGDIEARAGNFFPPRVHPDRAGLVAGVITPPSVHSPVRRTLVTAS